MHVIIKNIPKFRIAFYKKKIVSGQTCPAFFKCGCLFLAFLNNY